MIDILNLKSLLENKSILIVDDNVDFQKIMIKFLDKLFKNVYCGDNGSEGLNLFKNKDPDFILTDLDMPIMDGYEMISHIKKINTNANIIVLSAHSTKASINKLETYNILEFMAKPFNDEKFLEILFSSLHEK